MALDRDTLEAIGIALHGPDRWKEGLEKTLNVDDRRLRRWLMEGSDIPPGVADDLRQAGKEKLQALASAFAPLGGLEL